MNHHSLLKTKTIRFPKSVKFGVFIILIAPVLLKSSIRALS